MEQASAGKFVEIREEIDVRLKTEEGSDYVWEIHNIVLTGGSGRPLRGRNVCQQNAAVQRLPHSRGAGRP